MLGAGVSQESMGLGIVQVSQGPVCTQSMFDPVSGHIPVKIKEKIWVGEYVDRGVRHFRHVPTQTFWGEMTNNALHISIMSVLCLLY